MADRWEQEARAWLASTDVLPDDPCEEWACPHRFAAFAREVEARVWEEAAVVCETLKIPKPFTKLDVDWYAPNGNECAVELRQRAARARGEETGNGQ